MASQLSNTTYQTAADTDDDDDDAAVTAPGTPTATHHIALDDEDEADRTITIPPVTSGGIVAH